jgi:hypothetical protein
LVLRWRRFTGETLRVVAAGSIGFHAVKRPVNSFFTLAI